ncbi:uncharacterized protein LOC100905311 [Galendromus occidentalis]|uniref:Uncharacterized protein LOC100905311 n=1 Tax=Galendromus occidentalis TaxID=34638 RepID=A0AAJ6VUI3_9ACAR|nr:uncharacterized protein LOC100905311 [Galendromus occidentalis]
MSVLGSWSFAQLPTLHGLKPLLRGLVDTRIRNTLPDPFPLELELALFLVPSDNREKTRFPGPRYHFSGTFSSAPELQAFLETELELLDFSIEPDYKVQIYWHHVCGMEYKWRLREIEAQKRGVPPPKGIESLAGEDSVRIRKELDRKLQCLE